MIDWENLPLHEPLRSEAYKSIGAIFPLVLKGEISTNTIAITDEGLELVPHTQDEVLLATFRQYLNEKWRLPFHTQMVLNHFDASRKERWGFEMEERIRILCLAVRLLTAQKCFSLATFKYNDEIDPPEFYRPFVDKNPIGSGIPEEETSIISSVAEFEQLQLLYSKLVEINPFKYDDRFSKLLNAVRFYSRINETAWFLQKIVHAFVGLESLFSDQTKSEITYKVSIRTAYFLYPDDSKERHAIYDLLKIAYDVRSSFLHGSKVDETKLTKKLQELKQSAEYDLWFALPNELNYLLSKAIEKILLSEDHLAFFNGDPDSKKEAAFYDQLVLGTK
jgi:hypothetical protein